MAQKNRVLMTALIAVVGSTALLLLLAAVWRHCAFKYMFQFVSSGGLLATAFYYFARTRVPGNVKKGMIFLILSPVFFGIGELLFNPFIITERSISFHSNPLGHALRQVLLTEITHHGEGVRVWHVLLTLELFANALALAKRPTRSVLISVNLVALLGTILIYLVSRQ